MSQMVQDLNSTKEVSSDLLVVSGLQVQGVASDFTIVDEISFTLAPGRTLGIVGESGSGKSTVAMSLLGFSREGCKISSGSVLFNGKELLTMSEKELRGVRGRDVTYVPQDPATGLNPNMRIGAALQEMLNVHASEEANPTQRIDNILKETQLPISLEFKQRYPFELSGGQQQRIAIALALITNPNLIVMDEPTTGLDVTTQSKFMNMIKKLIIDRKKTMVYVSHDLGVIRKLVDDVAIMYGGRIVEQGNVVDVFSNPLHPYTRALLEAVPRASALTYKPKAIPGTAIEPWNWPSGCPFAPRCDYKTIDCDISMPVVSEPLKNRIVRCINLKSISQKKSQLVVLDYEPSVSSESKSEAMALNVEKLSASFMREGLFKKKDGANVVKEISFQVYPGDCIAIVGESGSGKTTTLRCIAGLHKPKNGTVSFFGEKLKETVGFRSKEMRRLIQLIPQNPDSSLNPKMPVGQIIKRPIDLFFDLSSADKEKKIAELLDQVHLTKNILDRFSKDLSGGEKQRVAIARALAVNPRLLLCDEVVSSLDVAVQAGILDLLRELRMTSKMTLVFVTHDLGVVRSIASNVVVMKDGSILERGITKDIFENSSHEYTLELIKSIPNLEANDYPGSPT